MCMEDKRIGRKTATAHTVLSIDATNNGNTVPANPMRTHLCIGTSNGTIIAAPSPAGLTNGGGFVTGATMPPLDFDIETHGDIVTKAWIIIAPGGAQNCSVIESFIPKD